MFAIVICLVLLMCILFALNLLFIIVFFSCLTVIGIFFVPCGLLVLPILSGCSLPLMLLLFTLDLGSSQSRFPASR